MNELFFYICAFVVIALFSFVAHTANKIDKEYIENKAKSIYNHKKNKDHVEK